MSRVSQNSDALRAIATEIETGAGSFEAKYVDLFDSIAKAITEAETPASAWWGPNAVSFYGEVSPKIDEFRTAKQNITSMATNLREQAQAWDSFESN